MRTPDPKYIQNLIVQLLGKELYLSLADNLSSRGVWYAYKLVGRVLESKLAEMHSGTLARIIEYSDADVVVGTPPIVRRQLMEGISNKSHYSEPMINHFPDKVFHGYCGRKLLQKAALVTLLMIIVDMFDQAYYKSLEALCDAQEMDEQLAAEEEEAAETEGLLKDRLAPPTS